MLDWDGQYYQCVQRCGCSGGHRGFLHPHDCLQRQHSEFLPFQYRRAVSAGYFVNWEGPTDQELLSSTPAPPVVQTAVQTPPVDPPVVPTEWMRWGGQMRAEASSFLTSAPTPTLLRLRQDEETVQSPTVDTPAQIPTQPEQNDWQSWWGR